MKMKKNKKPLVTVLIPVFNGAAYLKEAVQSVLKSTYRKHEIILVDDGSKDKSKQLCMRLEKKYKRVRFYGFSRNGGMVRSLNFGVSRAKGKYIARLNQDDYGTKTTGGSSEVFGKQ